MIIKNGSSCICAGRVIKDAEYKTVGDKQTPLTKFSISYEYHQDGSGLMSVDCWRELAAAARNIKKGDRVIVAGVLSSNDYNGKTYWSIAADAVAKSITAIIDENGFEELPADDVPNF